MPEKKVFRVLASIPTAVSVPVLASSPEEAQEIFNALRYEGDIDLWAYECDPPDEFEIECICAEDAPDLDPEDAANAPENS